MLRYINPLIMEITGSLGRHGVREVNVRQKEAEAFAEAWVFLGILL